MGRKINHDLVLEIQQSLKAYQDNNHNKTNASKELGIPRTTLISHLNLAERHGITTESDIELVLENVRLAKLKQKQQDTNRIERKAFREHARIENAIEALNTELLEILKKHKFKPPKRTIPNATNNDVAVLHLSDNHLNEQIDLPHNQYNWTVASQRLHKLVAKVKFYCKAHGINKVLVAFTGDLLNSDRRLDEALSNSTNRASACVLAVHLYGQVLNDLAHDLHVSVASINGNESRMTKDVGWSKEVASDNYDALIYNMLRMQHGDYVTFSDAPDHNEQVVNVAGQNVLMMHGHGSKASDQKQIQDVIGRYALRGVAVDMVISGHIHMAIIADQFARSSSLCGSNDYAEGALGLTGRASQNIYLVHQSGGFDGIKVDLQDVSQYEGYDIAKELETYNTKSAAKAHQKTTIFEVVI